MAAVLADNTVTATSHPKQHISQVDYIRAIASVAVALFHLGGKVLPVLKYGWLGVQMFFLLSGFIICWAMPLPYQPKNSGRFILKRLIRIEPPYIISIALILLLNFIFIGNYRPDWPNVAFHLAYLNTYFGKPALNPVYWTLGIEFQFYLFVALLFPLFISKWGKWLLPLLCLLRLWIDIPQVALFSVFPMFVLGMQYYLYRTRQCDKIYFIISTAVATICLYHFWGLLPACATLFALLILILPLKSNPVVLFLAKISFSLYLTHDIVGSRLVVYLGTLLPKTFLFKGIVFLTGIAVSIAFAWLFYRLVELTFLKMSKRITYRHTVK